MINSRETDNLGKIFYIWGKNILLKKYNIPFEYNFYTHILNALIQRALRTPELNLKMFLNILILKFLYRLLNAVF